MNKQRIVDALNEDRSFELAAIMQYMHQHYMAEGMESPELVDKFKEAAIGEMKHAYELAERIVQLGGEPTIQRADVKTGGDLRQMLKYDLDDEKATIERYRQHIQLCSQEGDPTSRRLLEELLADEEGHCDMLGSILGRGKD